MQPVNRPLFSPMPFRREILDGNWWGRNCVWLSEKANPDLITYGLSVAFSEFVLGKFPTCREDEDSRGTTPYSLAIAIPMTCLLGKGVQKMLNRYTDSLAIDLTWKRVFQAIDPSCSDREELLVTLACPLSLSMEVRKAYLSGGKEVTVKRTPWFNALLPETELSGEVRALRYRHNDLVRGSREAYAFAVQVEEMVRFFISHHHNISVSHAMIAPFSYATIEWMTISLERFKSIFAHSIPPFLQECYPALFAHLNKQMEEAAAEASPHKLFLATLPLTRITKQREWCESEEDQLAHLYYLLCTDEIEPLFDSYLLAHKTRETLQDKSGLDPITGLIEALNSKNALQVYFAWTTLVTLDDFKKLMKAQLAVKEHYSAFMAGQGPEEVRKWLEKIALPMQTATFSATVSSDGSVPPQQPATSSATASSDGSVPPQQPATSSAIKEGGEGEDDFVFI